MFLIHSVWPYRMIIVSEFLSQLLFLVQRLTWLSVLDLTLVTLIFFAILLVVRDTQAVTLLRGVVLLIILISLMTSLINLPAFSWLVKNALPVLLLSIPVIFAPEIRRGLEKLGRAGGGPAGMLSHQIPGTDGSLQQTVKAVTTACARLSARQHGALIILQRGDSLRDYIQTGVVLNARVSPELLMQIFYPNTPLHDGAVIISNNLIVAGSCVMPLSASGILNRTPDRQMGLRHRAALGISEASDAVAVVVSEETGSISIAHGGRMIRRLDSERLENILLAFYRPEESSSRNSGWLKRVLRIPSIKQPED
ncbi:TIGR00159 family protein [Leptolinea tardivitalis]|nr:TIGR00159 family protein [Leptolinea tardivitalis]